VALPEGQKDSEANHYKGFVPVGDVASKLFYWDALALPFYVNLPEFLGTDGVTEARTVEVSDRVAIVHPETGVILGRSGSPTVTQFRDALIEKLSQIVGESRGDLGIGSRPVCSSRVPLLG
jgi:hypothetical protein